MSLITPIVDERPKIIRAEQSREVDDSASFTDGLTQTRTWNLITNDSKVELTLFDVVDQLDEFQIGIVIGQGNARRRLDDMRLRNTESDAVYTLECDFVPFEYKTPLLVPIEWTWETTRIDVPTFSDFKGKPLVTAAGEPIVGQTRPVKAWVISGSRNVSRVPEWFRDIGVSVNKDRVKLDGETFAPGTLQLQKVSLGNWEEQEVDGKTYRYRPLSFEFWFNPVGWKTVLGNLGYLELQTTESVQTITDADTGEQKTKKVRTLNQVRATDDGGEPTTARVWLDKKGLRPRGDDGKPKKSLAPKELEFLEFDLLEELAYGPLLK